MVSLGKFYFFVGLIFFSQLFFSQKSLSAELRNAFKGECEGEWFFRKRETGFVSGVSDAGSIDELSSEARIHLILPIERLGLRRSAERAVEEAVNYIGGLTEMTEKEARDTFGSLEAVEIKIALLSKGLNFGMSFKWPLDPDKIRKIQLEAREVAIAKLRPDQKVNLFRHLAELNLRAESEDILRSSGMYYVGTLAANTEKAILRISNDRYFLQEIKDALSKLDLALGKIYDWPNRPDQVERLKERFEVSLNSPDVFVLQ